jgi:type II pantothenate kinase
MVFETVAMVSVFAARQSNVKDVILTGNLTRLPLCAQKFNELAGFGYGVNFIIPENSEFATVIGSALAGITP